MQSAEIRTASLPFPYGVLPMSCAGSPSPGKDMPTPPAPDPVPDPAAAKKPAKKKK